MAESCKWLVLNVRKLKSVGDSKTLGPVKYNRLVSYITIDPLDDDIDHEFIGQCRAELGQLEQWPNIDETREIYVLCLGHSPRRLFYPAGIVDDSIFY